MLAFERPLIPAERVIKKKVFQQWISLAASIFFDSIVLKAQIKQAHLHWETL